MRTRMTGAERRQWVDKLLEEYAAVAWAYLVAECDTVEQAEDAFVYAFILANERLAEAHVEPVEDWMMEILREAVREAPVDSDWREQLVDADGQVAEVKDAVAQGESLRVPQALIQRSVQMMRANIARDEAMRHHRGPLWTKVGAALAVVVGIAGVGYGVSDKWARHFQNRPPVSAQADATEKAVAHLGGDLPVSPVAVYQLDASTHLDVNHLAVNKNSLYQGTLVLSADSWPRIEVSQQPFSTKGVTLGGNVNATYTFELVPPLQASGKKSDDAWEISNWHIEVMGNWIVGVISWNDGGSSDTNVQQIYALSTKSGKYSLVDTLAPQHGVENRFEVAVGDGKIVVQPGLDDGSSAPLGLPIQIYTLKGDDPTHAWTEDSQIPASFGLMQTPVVTQQGIIFQGIAGKAQTSSDNVDTWYELTWDGTMNHYDGPPVDGQVHWAVVGSSGTAWWVETTPDASDSHQGYQVSMAQLSDDKSNGSPTKSLAQPVLQLAVDNGNLIWLQQGTDKDEDTLVVAQVE
ncbi:hypothetical protein AAC03nite_16540 [Alicyclobacillus acidoterrestris]|nr:hypothetical protein AAC03nite_16540 [Alicyclobacillus acidoterrestris]